MAIRLSTNRLDLGSANLTNAELRGWSETVNALGNVTGATTIDLSSGNVITATTTGATTWTVTNASATNTSSFTLILTNGGSQTQTYPSGTQWSQGVAPTLNSSGTDILTFFTTDAGTTWRGAKGGPTAVEQTGQKLFVWGAGGSGELGLGDSFNRSSPVQLVGQWKKVAASASVTHAIRVDGSLWSWGAEGAQLGLGTTFSRSSPVQVGSATDWVAVAGCDPDGGTKHSFGLRADGSLWAWGYGQYGKLGLGDVIARSSPTQVSGTWKSIARVGLQVGAIRSDGSLWTWGWNTVGQLGLGDVSVNRSSPVQVLGTWTQLCMTNTFSFAIRGDGSLWSWGNGASGYLGLGDTVSRSSPVQITGTWKAVHVHQGGGFAIKSDGSLWAWGGQGNSYGSLGVGDNIVRSSPTQIAGTWIAVPGSYTQGMAVKEGGSLWTWGRNSTDGMLGIGVTTGGHRSSPTQIVGTWLEVFPSRGHSFGLRM